MDSIIKIAVTPVIAVEIAREDADGKAEVIKWRLCLDYRAIAKIEEATGRQLMKSEQWQDLATHVDFTKVIHGCLNRYHPDVTLDEVTDSINPAGRWYLYLGLINEMFPKALDKLANAPKTEPDSRKTA